MRVIGYIENEKCALTFCDYLYAHGIKNEIESRPVGDWAVWVHDEEELKKAKELLTRYLRNPADPKYRNAVPKAQRLRKKEDNAEVVAKKRHFDRSRVYSGLAAHGVGRLTIALIVLCAIVAVISKLGADKKSIFGLFITENIVFGSLFDRLAGLAEIRHGQVWRLFTPVLIHFGLLHLLFNMLWLYDLGNMIERNQGPWRLALKVIVIAVGSNLGQYIASGPVFGGMSGVVYGLLGYIWMRGKYDLTSGLFLHPQIVTMMIIWFFLCLSGLMGSVANTAHGVGLVMGMAWGYLSAHGYWISKRH